MGIFLMWIYFVSLLVLKFLNWLLYHGVIFLNFQAPMLEKNCPKKYNIDYFGYAANLEVKFKLNFDEEK